MEKNTYYFSKYPTGYLLALLEQTDNKLTLLKARNIESKSTFICHRINYLKTLTILMRECITERFLNEKKNLTEYGKMLLNAKKDVEKDILKDVFTTVLLTNQGLIELNFFKSVINCLDIDHLQKIIDSGSKGIYIDVASDRFNELLFQVDEEAKDELKQKMINDNRGC